MNEDPDMEKRFRDVAMDVASEYIAGIYKGLRKQGLSRIDAANIVAAMISHSEQPGEDSEQNEN